MPNAGFTPQTAVEVLVIDIDPALEQTPTVIEACLLACPDNENMRLEFLSVGYTAETLPVDAGTTDVDIEFIDDSDSDTITILRENFDLTAGTARVYNNLWRGSQILDPGDVINAAFTTDGALSTASEGAALIVEYRVLMRS